MDNVTHTLTALALSQAGLKRKTRYATWTLIIGANLPDIDSVSGLGGAADYLKYHRGVTHSLLGAAVLAVLLAGIINAWGRNRPPAKKYGPEFNARWLFAVSGIAVGSHILMDFTNAYGIRPFLPFSSRWYAWDIMFITDPLLLLFLVAGLAMPAIFRLVSEEVGAKKPMGRRGAVAALVCMAVLWGVRDLAHRRVLGYLNSHTYGQEDPIRLGAFPSPINPFDWMGVVETDSAFYVLDANALDSDVGAENARTFHKPGRSPALDAAMNTRTGKIFSDFARFLWAQVDPTEDGYEVKLRDLRFVSIMPPQRAVFEVEVRLDDKFHVRSESFTF